MPHRIEIGVWRVKVALHGDTSAVGTPAAIDVRLEPDAADAASPSPLMLVPSWETGASLEPAMAEHDPAGDPARFTFTAHEPGRHSIRFHVYDHASGRLMQELAVAVEVTA